MDADRSPLGTVIHRLPLACAMTFAAGLAAMDFVRSSPDNAASEAKVARMILDDQRQTGWASVQGRHGSLNPRAPKYMERAGQGEQPGQSPPSCASSTPSALSAA